MQVAQGLAADRARLVDGKGKWVCSSLCLKATQSSTGTRIALIHSSVQASSLLPLRFSVLRGCNFNFKVVPTSSYSGLRNPLEAKISQKPTATQHRKQHRREQSVISLIEKLLCNAEPWNGKQQSTEESQSRAHCGANWHGGGHMSLIMDN